MTFLIRYTLGSLLFLCGFFPTLPARAIPDSVANYSYRELERLIHQNKHDSLLQSLYLERYLQKAHEEKNVGRMALYYRSFVFYQAEDNRLNFIDSALHYAYQTSDTALIGTVYLTKATVYHTIKDYQNTLDHYLKADEYISRTDDIYNKYRIKNHIAAIKNYLGYYNEAEVLFEECIAYFGQNEESYNMQRGYISSLIGLAWVYTKTHRLDKSKELLAKARASAEKAGFSELDVHYAVFKQGINSYFLGEYKDAIHTISEKLPFLYENEDFAWASIGMFYMGKSYREQGDIEKAISLFQQVDEIFEERQYTHPDLREAYEYLIDHYKGQGDKDQQLKYITRLVQVDSVYHQNHIYLIGQIHRKYHTKDLLQAQRDLEMALYFQKNRTAFITMGAILILTLGWAGMYYRQITIKKNAQAIIDKIKLNATRSALPVPESVKVQKSPSLLKDEITEKLALQLDKFEKNKDFLKPNITLESMANSLRTNTSYLSKYLNAYKGQKFQDYLNTLRIDYMIADMTNNKDSELFKYSTEALAQQIGFTSASTFARTFRSRTNTTPAAFIKEARKSHSGAA